MSYISKKNPINLKKREQVSHLLWAEQCEYAGPLLQSFLPVGETKHTYNSHTLPPWAECYADETEGFEMESEWCGWVPEGRE